MADYSGEKGKWTKSFPGSRSAPTVVGDLLYVGTGLGNLLRPPGYGADDFSGQKTS